MALVVEGGGMRGVVSAGMAAAIERLGLTRCFDLVVGSSAGAINAAALLAGIAEQGAETYHRMLASRAWVNPVALLRGRPVIDVEAILLRGASALDRRRTEDALAGRIEFHCVATQVETARAAVFADLRTPDEVVRALLASSRMPWAGGPPVRIGDARYLDGAMASSVPVPEALAAGATHALVLQTRPHGVPRRGHSWIADRFIERHLRSLNPALVDLYRRRIGSYERLVDEIADRSIRPAPEPPHLLGIRPPAGTPCVGQIERRAQVLATAAADAERQTDALLRPALAGGPTYSSGSPRSPR
jgi:predicted patatin/cPLA2 family phospholipase